MAEIQAERVTVLKEDTGADAMRQRAFRDRLLMSHCYPGQIAVTNVLIPSLRLQSHVFTLSNNHHTIHYNTSWQIPEWVHLTPSPFPHCSNEGHYLPSSYYYVIWTHTNVIHVRMRCSLQQQFPCLCIVFHCSLKMTHQGSTMSNCHNSCKPIKDLWMTKLQWQNVHEVPSQISSELSSLSLFQISKHSLYCWAAIS